MRLEAQQGLRLSIISFHYDACNCIFLANYFFIINFFIHFFECSDPQFLNIILYSITANGLNPGVSVVCAVGSSWLTLMTLMMTSAQVVQTSVNVTNNSPSRDYYHPDDQTTQTIIQYIAANPELHETF